MYVSYYEVISDIEHNWIVKAILKNNSNYDQG